MCGITGFLDVSKNRDDSSFQAVISYMMDAIRHRGPDDSGEWMDAQNGIALGFRRLAIIDLSPAGHQPMVSADGRYVIIFNGEVYNFNQLRNELAGLGHAFRGHSDTEVMLASICQWGIPEAVQRFNGMFAFGLLSHPGTRPVGNQTALLWLERQRFPFWVRTQGFEGPSCIPSRNRPGRSGALPAPQLYSHSLYDLYRLSQTPAWHDPDTERK
jgi:hypothetical protein